LSDSYFRLCLFMEVFSINKTSEKTVMSLFSESPCFIRFQNSIPVLFLLLFTLISCSSADDTPVQWVDSIDRLSEIELQQFKQQQTEWQVDTYYFGFDLRASPQEDAAQYIPFLNYLEAATNYHFKLYFTPKDSSAADELGQNRTQFAAIGATGFLYAESRYDVRLLARGRNELGKAEYQSVFVTRNNAPIRNTDDIKGHKLAFGSQDSTQGHLIPRIMLAENGISLDDIASYNYMGSHQKCAEAVVSGKYDVCGMQDQLAEKLVSEGELKIIHRSRYYPSSGIVANSTVPAEVIEKVKLALLDFDPQGKDRQALYHWDRTEMPGGFVAGRESDYSYLREWSHRLGFLHDSDAQESPQ
jgi:phosphonate transport system substrate-binding protein